MGPLRSSFPGEFVDQRRNAKGIRRKDAKRVEVNWGFIASLRPVPVAFLLFRERFVEQRRNAKGIRRKDAKTVEVNWVFIASLRHGPIAFLLFREKFVEQRRNGILARQSSADDGENLDLMLVNEATFEGMWSAALDRSIAGCTVKIPSLDHLIALKLHVLKQNLTHRSVKDLDDIIRLMLANHIDPRTPHYQHLFEKYGTAEEYQRVLRAIHGA